MKEIEIERSTESTNYFKGKKKKTVQSLHTFERKVLRTIFGPVHDHTQNRWRRRYNHELMQLYGEPSIVRTTKINRLRWLGHVQRMDDNRVPKKVLKTKPEGKRSAGRPKSRRNLCRFENCGSIQLGDVSCG